ncbi:MAG: homocysteine S-methyltransferase [Acidobacteriaceae bacterium]|jgi:homocysteine S-methyltransferase|nr:homocysteine S-methyltransferase [Acidobacteriaceae bacterium]
MTARDGLDLTGLRVLDGGLATELERAGCDLASPLWSGEVLRTQPEKVLAVHRSYLEAGADCLLTASYQVSAMGFREIGLDASAAEQAARTAIQQSVALAEQARREYAQTESAAGRKSRPIWIAGSLGAYGAALHNGAEFHGRYDVSHAALVDFHTERIEAMRETAADFLAFETVPSLADAEAILDALARFPDLAAYISFTCRDGSHTGHGEPIKECARLLDAAQQAIALGINCTAPRHILPLIRKVRVVTGKRIAVYPNSGETWVGETRSWAGTSDPHAFGDMAHQWRDAGADWIGGCCRTGPEHIRAIVRGLTPFPQMHNTKARQLSRATRSLTK